MKPFLNLATAQTPDGGELSLHQHDGHFYLRANRQPLMGTNAAESEKVLAQQACKRIHGQSARVLIGGLGFGFSLRRVLEVVGKKAEVHVAELLPAVVQWNREYLGEVNGKLLDDPRVTVFTEDVFRVLGRSQADPYDAILLDVDNGPIAMVQEGNGILYHRHGLASIWRALKPRGRVTFWSARQDDPFAKRLAEAGFKVDVVAAKSHEQARRCSHTIFVGDRLEAPVVDPNARTPRPLNPNRGRVRSPWRG